MTEEPPGPSAARWPGPRPGELIDPQEMTGADLDAEIIPEPLSIRVYVEETPGMMRLAGRVEALRWPGGAVPPQIRVVVDLGARTVADVIVEDPAAAALAEARRARDRLRETQRHMRAWAAGEETHRDEAGEDHRPDTLPGRGGG